MKRLLDQYKSSSGGIADNNQVIKRPAPHQITAKINNISSTKLKISNHTKSIIFQGHEGFSNSVTHYYHFLFGAFIPLLEYHIANKKAVGYKIVTDIGPMKSLLCELPINIIEICGPENTKTRSFIESFSVDPNDNNNTSEFIALPAYDSFVESLYPEYQDLKMSTITKVNNYLQDTIPPYISLTPTFDVILIERTNKESYYRDVEIDEKHRSSGASLRSIRNHVQLENSLKEHLSNTCFTFANITLERSSIYYQYHLFKHAKVIIAQHGAALSNIVFVSNPDNAYVIEINPPTQSKSAHGIFKAISRTHFKNLSKHIGIRKHVTVLQDGDQSNVNIEEILGHIDDIIQDISTACTNTSTTTGTTTVHTAVLTHSSK